MDSLSAGGFVLAVIAFVYTVQLGLQMRKLKRKIEEIERIEKEILKK